MILYNSFFFFSSIFISKCFNSPLEREVNFWRPDVYNKYSRFFHFDGYFFFMMSDASHIGTPLFPVSLSIDSWNKNGNQSIFIYRTSFFSSRLRISSSFQSACQSFIHSLFIAYIIYPSSPPPPSTNYNRRGDVNKMSLLLGVIIYLLLLILTSGASAPIYIYTWTSLSPKSI